MAFNKYIFIAFLFCCLTTSCQKPVVGVVSRLPHNNPVLIIMAGESNSGGLADNSLASAPEVAARNIKILNNTTLTSFDALDIGTNNLVDHVGLLFASSVAHGWELQLANRYDDGDFGNKTVYIVKAGQGGTTGAMWADEATYSAEAQTIEPYDTWVSRVQAALHLIDSIHHVVPQIVMWWSLGYNDIVAGTNVDVYKDEVQAVFTSMRTEIGIDFPIIQTQFQSINTAYDTAIDDITGLLDDVYKISTSGAETSQTFCCTGNHWGYTGAKLVSDRFIDLTLTILH